MQINNEMVYDVFQFVIMLLDYLVCAFFLTPKFGRLKNALIYLPAMSFFYAIGLSHKELYWFVCVVISAQIILILLLFQEKFQIKLLVAVINLICDNLADMLNLAVWGEITEEKYFFGFFTSLGFRAIIDFFVLSILKKLNSARVDRKSSFFIMCPLLQLLMFIIYGFVARQTMNFDFFFVENMNVQFDSFLRTAILANSLRCMLIMSLHLRGLVENAEKTEKQMRLKIMRDKSELDWMYFSEWKESAEKTEEIKTQICRVIDDAQAAYARGEKPMYSQASIRALGEKTDAIVQEEYCRNPLLNSILTVKQLYCRMDQIKMTCEIYLPEQLPFEEMDLCRMMNNLLDNAIRAAGKSPMQTGEIAVKIYCEGKNFFFCVRNSLADGTSVNADSRTTKKEKKMHGYGLSIVKDIVKKYDGEFVIKTVDRTCSAVACLKTPTAEAMHSRRGA